MIDGHPVPHVKPNALSKFSTKNSFSSTRGVYCGSAITSVKIRCEVALLSDWLLEHEVNNRDKV